MCPISTPRSPGRRGCPSSRAACAKSGPISCRRAEAERMDARRAVEQAARDSYGRLLAFLAPPAAMGQRLSRAKAKIRDAGIAFAVPEASELAPRLDAVLEAIYAAYGSGWDDVAGADPRRKGLAVEAIELGRLLLRLLPGEPETQGLLALMLHCEAQRAARRSASGEYVPLSEQDTALWSEPLIAQAQELLIAAERAGRVGRFQLEAAIQSMHARRDWAGSTDWEAVALLFEGLVRLATHLDALVGRAAASAEARDAATDR